MEKKIKILYIDDEQNNLNAFFAHFRRNKNYEILTCQSGEEGLRILNTTPINIVIVDQAMPNMTGVEFIEHAIKKYPDPVRIVVTAHRDLLPLEIAYKEGKIFKYFDKPWTLDNLEKTIEDAYLVYCKNLK